MRLKFRLKACAAGEICAPTQVASHMFGPRGTPLKVKCVRLRFMFDICLFFSSSSSLLYRLCAEFKEDDAAGERGDGLRASFSSCWNSN